MTEPVVILAKVIGLGLLSAAVAGLVAFLFRWQTKTALPQGPALLLALGTVAVYLNTRIALIQYLGTGAPPLDTGVVALNLGIFVVSGFTAAAGWYAGDRLARTERVGAATLQPDLSPIVRATGRFISVTLPEDVDDITGYDPVGKETKIEIAGETYDFSRRLTVEQLETALATRLKTDHDIGHIDVDIAADGTVEYLAVGRRLSGIGPTLSPGTRATALEADPAFSASPGDTVQVWNGEAGERIGTGELRATVGRTATISASESVIQAIEARSSYRLMTLSADERIDRTFASMLRRASKTMTVIDVSPGTTAAGMTVGETGLSIIAIKRPNGRTETIPSREQEINAGDHLFVIGEPSNLRRLETAATSEASYEPPSERPHGGNRTHRTPLRHLTGR